MSTPTGSAQRSRPRPPEKLGRRDRRRAEIRERLFHSALTLFMTKGLQATTVKDITEAADVGKGTFFNHFPTKEHVLAAFYEMQHQRVADSLRVVRENPEAVRMALEETMRRTSQEARSPAFTRSFLIAIVSSGAVREIVLPQLRLIRQRYEELYALGQQRGEIRRDKPASELARVMQAMTWGTALLWSLQPEVPLEDLLKQNMWTLWPSRAAGPAARATRAKKKTRKGN